MSGSNRRNWSSLSAWPEPKSPTSARSAGVHMALSKQEITCNAARQAASARQIRPLSPLQTGTESGYFAWDIHVIGVDIAALVLREPRPRWHHIKPMASCQGTNARRVEEERVARCTVFRYGVLMKHGKACWQERIRTRSVDA